MDPFRSLPIQIPHSHPRHHFCNNSRISIKSLPLFTNPRSFSSTPTTPTSSPTCKLFTASFFHPITFHLTDSILNHLLSIFTPFRTQLTPLITLFNRFSNLPFFSLNFQVLHFPARIG